jgi:hypothetical protein
MYEVPRDHSLTSIILVALFTKGSHRKAEEGRLAPAGRNSSPRRERGADVTSFIPRHHDIRNPTRSTSQRIITQPLQRFNEPENWRLLPLRRPRRLSIPLPEMENGNLQIRKTYSQDQSWFFSRLPKDIRLLIYEQVLGERVLHIVRRRTKLGNMLCKAAPGHICTAECRGIKLESGITAGSGDGGYSQILQTCRMM